MRVEAIRGWLQQQQVQLHDSLQLRMCEASLQLHETATDTTTVNNTSASTNTNTTSNTDNSPNNDSSGCDGGGVGLFLMEPVAEGTTLAVIPHTVR